MCPRLAPSLVTSGMVYAWDKITVFTACFSAHRVRVLWRELLLFGAFRNYIDCRFLRRQRVSLFLDPGDCVFQTVNEKPCQEAFFRLSNSYGYEFLICPLWVSYGRRGLKTRCSHRIFTSNWHQAPLIYWIMFHL